MTPVAPLPLPLSAPGDLVTTVTSDGIATRLPLGSAGMALVSDGSLLAWKRPGRIDVLHYGVTYGEGVSNAVATANTEAINNAIEDAEAHGFVVEIFDKVGINGSIVARPTVKVIGTRLLLRKSLFSDCSGPWLYFTGTVAPLTPMLKIGDKAQTEQFDNCLFEDIGLHGSDIQSDVGGGTLVRSSIGIKIRSNGLISSATYRTKGLTFRRVNVSSFAFYVDIGPVPESAPLKATWSTAAPLKANQFVVPTVANGYVYRAVVEGTTHAADEPGSGTQAATPWPTTPGATVVSGTVTFMNYGAIETNRLEEQSDDILWERCDFWAGTNPILGITANGANAGDLMTMKNCQLFGISAASNPYIDLLNGGAFDFLAVYGGGDAGVKDFVRFWTPGVCKFSLCQAEGMRRWLYKPSQASGYEREHLSFYDCYFDSPIYLDQYCRITGKGNIYGYLCTMLLNGAQWTDEEEYWADTSRTAYPITLSGAGSYKGVREKKASVYGWYMKGERILRRNSELALGAPTADEVFTGGAQAQARANTTSYAQYATVQNALNTHVFMKTNSGSHTSAGAEPGGMAAPTIGVSYTDGGVTWLCVGVVAVLYGVDAMPFANTYTVTNPTTLRSFDVAAATLGDLRQIVGTLITDLKTAGIAR